MITDVSSDRLPSIDDTNDRGHPTMKYLCKTMALTGVCFLLMASAALAAETLYVQVRSGQLKNKPTFLGVVIASLPYGDTVRLDAKQGDWRKVTSLKNGKTGWMHISGLTDQRVVLHPTNKDIQTAQGSRLSLSGAGANKEIEKQYQERTELDYSKVNQMENDSVSAKDISGFIRSGKLGNGVTK